MYRRARADLRRVGRREGERAAATTRGDRRRHASSIAGGFPGSGTDGREGLRHDPRRRQVHRAALRRQELGASGDHRGGSAGPGPYRRRQRPRDPLARQEGCRCARPARHRLAGPKPGPGDGDRPPAVIDQGLRPRPRTARDLLPRRRDRLRSARHPRRLGRSRRARRRYRGDRHQLGDPGAEG